MSKANERLYIRLPASANQICHWLIWDAAAGELIASGELSSAEQLSQLSDKAASRETTVFVASHGIALRQISIPSGAQRHLNQVVPYALEEELASDIDSLHFAWPQKSKQSELPVAVVAHTQMQTWLQWLKQADIQPKRMLPDVFMLPFETGKWQAMQLTGGDTLVRTGAWSGFAIETQLFEQLASQLVADELTPDNMPEAIVHYGDLNWPQPPALLKAADIEVPLTVVGQSSGGIDLLQGKYRQKQQRQRSQHNWAPLAIAAGVVAVLGLSLQITKLVSLNSQQQQLSQQIEQTYKQTFPNDTRIVNVRSQLNQHLQQVQGTGNQEGVLALLQQLEPAFAAQEELELELMRYDNGQLRLQVNGNSFEQLEAFRQLAEQSGRIRVSQGQVSQRDQQVSGAITVTWADASAGGAV